MKPHFTLYLFPVVFITACGVANTVESTGESLAAKNCECELIMREQESLVSDEVLKRIDALPTRDPNALWKIQQAVEKELDGEQDAARERRKACKEEYHKLKDQAKLDYPREDDRKTIGNMVKDREELCKKTFREEHPSWAEVLEKRRLDAKGMTAEEEMEAKAKTMADSAEATMKKLEAEAAKAAH